MRDRFRISGGRTKSCWVDEEDGFDGDEEKEEKDDVSWITTRIKSEGKSTDVSQSRPASKGEAKGTDVSQSRPALKVQETALIVPQW